MAELLDLPLYRVEDGIDPGPFLTEAGPILAYINRINRSRWWKQRSRCQLTMCLSWDKITGAVKRYWARGEIYVWHPMTPQDILHDATHILIWKGTADHGRADHRSEFLRVYLEAVEHFMGKRHANRLRGALLEARVHGAKKAFG